MIKPLLIFAGTASLFLGMAGIFIPGLPATPFILLTAGLYVRSSPSFYSKVADHRLTGQYINGASVRVKTGARNLAILIMWLMILLTSVFVVDNFLIITLLILAGIAGTYFKIRFFKIPDKQNM